MATDASWNTLLDLKCIGLAEQSAEQTEVFQKNIKLDS